MSPSVFLGPGLARARWRAGAGQERLRALLDAESARMFDPEAAVLGSNLPPQLGPLGAGTVSLVRGGCNR